MKENQFTSLTYRNTGIANFQLLDTLNKLEQSSIDTIETERITHVDHAGVRYPIHSFSMGSKSSDAPCLLYVGGIHGLERIGSEVVLAFMQTLIERLSWDESLTNGLKNLRLIFIPAANPVGLMHNTRSNGNGIDLMRNAPIDAEHRPPFLAGGHRLHRRIPWYRGLKDTAMEAEAQALEQLIEKECFGRPFSLVLDCHSGFGFQDRLWFPYAYSQRPMEHLADVYSLKKLLTRTYPHLDYAFEPQSLSYTSHGDLWDYLYQKSLTRNTTFLPLTMEMGSWRWVKKNPRQMISLTGIFNPIIPHRLTRVLRRHIILMEFLIRATRAWQQWTPATDQRAALRQQALDHWYSE